MGRLLRNFLMMLAVFGLVLAGPVQAHCASTSASVMSPCADMIVDEGSADHQQQDAPIKACTILQCPSTLPAALSDAKAVEAPASRTALSAVLPSRVMASAEPTPEQRPPIS